MMKKVKCHKMVMTAKPQPIVFWIYIPLIIIGTLNIIFFLLYQQANPTLSVWNQSWNYISSDIFKGLTASLLFPIFLFLFERKFRILEKREEERKQRQLQSVKESSKMWFVFCGVINEIAYLNLFKDRAKMVDILVRLENFNITSIGVVNSWKTFNLTEEDYFLLLYLIGFLYFSAKSTGNYIRYQEDMKISDVEMLQLQDSLVVIQNSIGGILTSAGISMLTLVMDLEETHIDKTKRKDIKANIEAEREQLKRYVDLLKREENEKNHLIAGYNGSNTQRFRKAADSLMDLMLSKNVSNARSEEIQESQEYQEFNLSFNQLPLKQRLSVEKFAFSMDFLNYMGQRLSFESVLGYFEYR